MDNSEQVHDLINTLRERPHVVEFAEKCAERAESYARDSAATAAARYADSSYYAAAYATYSAAAAYVAYAEERDIQMRDLKELHAREGQA